MKIAQLPTDEDFRISDLQNYDLCNSSAENGLDEFVELAANICNCPISIITILDKKSQWFKAKRGTHIKRTARETALCNYTILQDYVFEIEDTKKDERFHDNPIVCGELNIRFYAGVPIISPSGYRLGSLCVIDHKPRTLSEFERKSLLLLATLITHFLELRVKNLLTTERATEILKMKSTAIKNVVDDSEKVKESIAIEMHENMAQIIAGCRISLQAALDNKKSDKYINEVIKTLGDLLIRMRNISNSLKPTGLSISTLGELLTDLVEKTKRNFGFQLDFTFYDSNEKPNPENNLICIRIIEKWLLALNATPSVKQARLFVWASEITKLQIIDNGESKILKDVEEYLCTSSIYNSVKRLKGNINYTTEGDENILTIVFDSLQ